MLMERFYDFRDDTGQIEFTGWRCLICGAIEDPLITAHRAARASNGKTNRTALTQFYSKLGNRLGTVRVPVRQTS
jgi:hypothetical protein